MAARAILTDMGATIHILWMALLLVAMCICLAKFGKRPKNLWRPLVSLVLAFFIGCFGFVITVVGSSEGTRSATHFFMYLVGSWLLLTFVESMQRAAYLTVGLFIYVLCHRFEYMSLSISSSYTDNPKHRFEMVKELNDERQKKGLSPIRNVKIQDSWHTLLTGLYKVEPSAGGIADFRHLDDLPDTPKS